MKQKRTARVSNPLKVAYQKLLTLPNVFRQRVCDQCGWSESTFYRNQRKPKACSKSERNTINQVYNQVLGINAENRTKKSKASHE